jgi:hypothetical protein
MCSELILNVSITIIIVVSSRCYKFETIRLFIKVSVT